MVKVQIKKLNPAVTLPDYKSDGASGMDLIAFLKSNYCKSWNLILNTNWIICSFFKKL